MRYIGIDLGDKRTGLALGDGVTRLATPAGLVEVPLAEDGGAKLLGALARAVDDLVGRGEHTLVVGLPLNADGTESARSKLTRAWAERLGERTGSAVAFQEERHTTDLAHKRLAQSGLTHKQKKTRRDAIAAAELLQRFLDGLPPREPRDWDGEAGDAERNREGRGANDW